MIEKKVKEANEKKAFKTPSVSKSILFVKAGEKSRKADKSKKKEVILDKANDWICKFDIGDGEEGNDYIFDQRVCVTDLKVDGYIVSHKAKICIVTELTSPMEENLDKWHRIKTHKYQSNLVSDKYQLVFLINEVGARGWIPETVGRNWRKLGFTKKEVQKTNNDCMLMAQRCSFIIFSQRFNKEFNPLRMTIGEEKR